VPLAGAAAVFGATDDACRPVGQCIAAGIERSLGR
jgi:hypothetical protein